MFKRGWERGRARIVARQTSEHGVRRGINYYAPTGRYHWVYDYVADVEPEGGGAVFRAKFTELFNDDEDHIRRPNVGEEAHVRFDPKTQEVEFDRDVLRSEAEASKSARAERFDAIADAAPASTARSAAARPGKLDMLRQVMAAQDRVQADVADQEPSSGTAAPASTSRSPVTPGDPIAQLERLAALRDRGVLTTTEFEAQKARILAQS
jgi:hypothetical protein